MSAHFHAALHKLLSTPPWQLSSTDPGTFGAPHLSFFGDMALNHVWLPPNVFLQMGLSWRNSPKICYSAVLTVTAQVSHLTQHSNGLQLNELGLQLEGGETGVRQGVQQ